MAYKDMYYTEEPFSRLCESCGKTFGKEDAFLVHTSCYPRHLITDNNFQCTQCHFVATSIQNLRQHLKCKHLVPKFMCLVPQAGGVCGEKFSLKPTILSHLQTAHFKANGRRKKYSGLKPMSGGIARAAHKSFTSIGKRVKRSAQSAARVPVVMKQDLRQKQSTTRERDASASCTISESADESGGGVGWDKLLDVSLEMLLQKMFHCSHCDGYFLTPNDLRDHFSVHADPSVPKLPPKESQPAVTSHCLPIDCVSTNGLPATGPTSGDFDHSVQIREQTVYLGSMTASADLLITLDLIQFKNLKVRLAPDETLNVRIPLVDCGFFYYCGADTCDDGEWMFAFMTVTKSAASELMDVSRISSHKVPFYKLQSYDPDGHASYVAFKVLLTHELSLLLHSMDRKYVTRWDRQKALTLFHDISDFNQNLLRSISQVGSQELSSVTAIEATQARDP